MFWNTLTIRARILLLLFFLAAALLGGVAAWRPLQERQARAVFQIEQHDKRVVIRRLVTLRGESLATFVFDYTYWDEMVRFVRTRDRTWGAQMLDTSLSTYKASDLWVYDRRHAPLYHARAGDSPQPAEPPEMRALLLRACAYLETHRFVHFFQQTPQGVLEIRGATIHRTHDEARTGPFYGFFFVARRWDRAYLAEMAKLTGCTVRLQPAESRTALPLDEAARGHLVVALPLPDLDGAPAAQLRFDQTSLLVPVIRDSIRRALLLFVLFAALLGLLFFCLLHWVSLPLSAIAIYLRTRRPAAIAHLVAQPGELGELARLAQAFFAQARALRQAHDEMEQRVLARTAELADANDALQAEVTQHAQTVERLRRIMTGARCLLWVGQVWERNDNTLRWELHLPDEAAARHWLPIAITDDESFFVAWRRAQHPDDRSALDARSAAALRNGQSHYRQEFRCTLASGEERWVCEEVQAQPAGDRRWHLVGVCTDVTERKRFETQMTHQAFHDALTGLPNRARFHEQLERALRRPRRAGAAVLFLDIDNFKVVNDSLGHKAGDALLVRFAERLRASARPGDTVARLGGDEFTLLLEEIAGPDEAIARAESVLEALRAPLVVENREVFAGSSIGIALAPRGETTPGELLRDADTALYQAKSRGKSGYALFDRSMNTRAMERLELESDLRRALDHDEMTLHYQPIVQLDSGRVLGVEALVRWEHPHRGLVAPGQFISIAEETGLIVPLGAWVLREACRQAWSWQTRYPAAAPLAVSVNLSTRQLQQPDLVDEVAGVLEETGLSPSCLTLEITESVMMQDADRTIAQLHALRALGVGLAMDDFGTGYSSLAYLRSLPIDTLKVDRSFVMRLGQSATSDADEGDEVVIWTILSLARALNLKVTSEGIETAEQHARLLAMGSDQGQGHYFAPALRADDLTVLLDAGPTLRRFASTSPALRAA